MAFQKGTSGNPNGRPRDTGAAAQLRKAITNEMPGIVQALIHAAKNGDVQAAKVLIDRVCPPLKPQAMSVNLVVDGSLADRGEEIIQAAMSGLIPPDIGSQLITALAGQTKILETSELISRIEGLEAKHNG